MKNVTSPVLNGNRFNGELVVKTTTKINAKTFNPPSEIWLKHAEPTGISSYDGTTLTIPDGLTPKQEQYEIMSWLELLIVWMEKPDVKIILDQFNTMNREKSDAHVSNLRHDFDLSRFLPLPNFLFFYTNKQTADGQSRMKGFYDSVAKGQYFYHARNVPRYIIMRGVRYTTFEFLDMGRSRTAVSMLKQAGKVGEREALDNPGSITAAANAVGRWVLRHDEPKCGKFDSFSTPQTLALVKLMEEDLEFVARLSRGEKGCKIPANDLPTGPILGLLTFFRATNPTLAEAVCRRMLLRRINNKPTDPAYLFSFWYANKKHRRSLAQQVHYWNRTAWMIKLSAEGKVFADNESVGNRKFASSEASKWLLAQNTALADKIHAIVKTKSDSAKTSSDSSSSIAK